MFVNTYNFTLKDANDADVEVSLRLGIGAQIMLKKKYKESTTSTLFGAADDVEKLCDVLTQALSWKGNENTIATGADLLELMNDNGMLGMIEKQKLLTAIGEASGLFSKTEKEKIDAKSDKMFDELLEEDEAEENGKNE